MLDFVNELDILHFELVFLLIQHSLNVILFALNKLELLLQECLELSFPIFFDLTLFQLKVFLTVLNKDSLFNVLQPIFLDGRLDLFGLDNAHVSGYRGIERLSE